ncbi:MAG: DUF6538 domain-containing protein [Betaproteobacteria bacterium]
MQATQHLHLYRRGRRGRYCVRKFIPRAIHDAYPPGRREVVRSLFTSDERKALKRSHVTLAEIKREFEEKRRLFGQRAERFRANAGCSDLMLISSETAPGLEALMLRQFLEGDDEQRRDMSKAGSFDLWRETLMQRLSQLKQALARHEVADWPGVLELVAKDAGIGVSISEVDQARAAELALRAATKAVQIQLDACAGEST